MLKVVLESNDDNQQGWGYGITKIGMQGFDYTGEGIFIGVYDDPIDFSHPAFRENGLPRRADGITTDGVKPSAGHGTHVAGIIGGNGALSNTFGDSDDYKFRGVERRGGEVVAFRNYEEGRPDYKTEFNMMRDVRFYQENRRRNIAKGASDIGALSSKDRKAYLSDADAIFPGLFIPATNPADAGAMVSQAAFHKVSGTYLGTSGWNGRELLIQGKKLVEGSYFSVPVLGTCLKRMLITSSVTAKSSSLTKTRAA